MENGTFINPIFQTQGQRVLDEAVKLKSVLAINDLKNLMDDTNILVARPFAIDNELIDRYKKQSEKFSHHSKLKTAMGTLAFVVGTALIVGSASAILFTLGGSTPFSFLGFSAGAGLLGLATWLGVSTTITTAISAAAGVVGLGGTVSGGMTFFKNVTKTKLAKEMDILLDMAQDNGDGLEQETLIGYLQSTR